MNSLLQSSRSQCNTVESGCQAWPRRTFHSAAGFRSAAEEVHAGSAGGSAPGGEGSDVERLSIEEPFEVCEGSLEEINGTTASGRWFESLAPLSSGLLEPSTAERDVLGIRMLAVANDSRFSCSRRNACAISLNQSIGFLLQRGVKYLCLSLMGSTNSVLGLRHPGFQCQKINSKF